LTLLRFTTIFYFVHGVAAFHCTCVCVSVRCVIDLINYYLSIYLSRYEQATSSHVSSRASVLCPVSWGYRSGSPTAVQAWQPCPLWELSPSHPYYCRLGDLLCYTCMLYLSTLCVCPCMCILCFLCSLCCFPNLCTC